MTLQARARSMLLDARRHLNLDRIIALRRPALTRLLQILILADVSVAVPDHREAVARHERVAVFLRLENVNVPAVAEARLDVCLRLLDRHDLVETRLWEDRRN